MVLTAPATAREGTRTNNAVTYVPAQSAAHIAVGHLTRRR